MVGWLVFKQLNGSRELSERAVQAAETVSEWSEERKDAELSAAREYNRELFGRGSFVYGEAVDPITGEVFSARDGEYQGLLNMDAAGMMARVRAPEVSIDLPVWHTTSDQMLAQGAGHLYGTSLPVGGADTHSVLSAHSGHLDAPMFLRLGELTVGDFVYIQTMGETLGYMVDRVEVIQPDNFTRFSITPGEDRLTLMTCTPIGINTERLLVSGLRHEIPQVMPWPDDAPGDGHLVWYLVGIAGVLILLGLGLLLWLRRRRRREERETVRLAAGDGSGRSVEPGGSLGSGGPDSSGGSPGAGNASAGGVGP
jgi:sortase A